MSSHAAVNSSTSSKYLVKSSAEPVKESAPRSCLRGIFLAAVVAVAIPVAVAVLGTSGAGCSAGWGFAPDVEPDPGSSFAAGSGVPTLGDSLRRSSSLAVSFASGICSSSSSNGPVPSPLSMSDVSSSGVVVAESCC